jgi:hypothetical protein
MVPELENGLWIVGKPEVTLGCRLLWKIRKSRVKHSIENRPSPLIGMWARTIPFRLEDDA